MEFDMKKDSRRILVIVLASALMAFNIKSFVRTGGLYPGGATGLTLLIQRSFELFFQIEIPYTIVNVILNIIPIYIGFLLHWQEIYSVFLPVLMLTNILTDIIPGFAITYDTLLISIFGGLINGFVISLCLWMNATTGGTDFIAIYFSEKKGIDSLQYCTGNERHHTDCSRYPFWLGQGSVFHYISVYFHTGIARSV